MYGGRVFRKEGETNKRSMFLLSAISQHIAILKSIDSAVKKRFFECVREWIYGDGNAAANIDETSAFPANVDKEGPVQQGG